MERRSLCQITLIVALIADHVDRRAGERAAQRHKNDQGIVRRRPLVHREICAEGDAAQGPRQHDVHVPKSERGRPHAAERETARRGEWWKESRRRRNEQRSSENWVIGHPIENPGGDIFGASGEHFCAFPSPVHFRARESRLTAEPVRNER